MMAGNNILTSESAAGLITSSVEDDDPPPIMPSSPDPFYSPLSKSQILSSSVHDDINAHSYYQVRVKVFFYHFFAVLSVGVLYLLTYWRPDWKVYLCCRKVELGKATHLLLEYGDDPVSVCKIEKEKVSGHFPSKFRIEAGIPEHEAATVDDGSSSEDSRDDQCHLLDNKRSNESGFFYRHFTHQHVKFVWCPEERQFIELSALDKNTSVAHVANGFHGDTAPLRQARWQLYGPNEIIVEVRSYFSLLFTEVLNPFYIFQILSIILWSLDEYYLYASCILFISCISVAVSLRETRQQSERLHAMVKTNQDATVEVLQLDGVGRLEQVTVGVSELVPGDVMLLPAEGCLVPCDCVLLTGTAIVNESMLTGESVPVAKAPLTVGCDQTELYDPEKHKRSTLFCGTLVVQTRYYNNTPVRAVVVRTGFSTAKGELVRSILFPKPMLFKFYQDSMKFIFVLFCVALIGMGYTFYLYRVRGLGWAPMLLRSLDLVTIVVPPALPAAMTVGTYYAQQRLHRSSIFCISPPRINVAGKLKLVVFDKTGTLTEDSLEVNGVVGIESVTSNTAVAPAASATSTGAAASSDVAVASNDDTARSLQLWQGARPVHSLPHDSKLMMALATCHDLTYVFGKLIGDPMDIKMFKATNWVLEEPTEGGFNSLMQTVVRPPECALLPPQAGASLEATQSSAALAPAPTPLNEGASTSNCGETFASLLGASDSRLPPVTSKVEPVESSVRRTSPIAGLTTVSSRASHTEGKNDSESPRPSHCEDADLQCSQDDQEKQISVLRSPREGDHDSLCGTNLFASSDHKVLVRFPSSSDQSSLSSEDDISVCELPATSKLEEQMPLEVGVLRVLAFSSEVQRMSVVVRKLGAPSMELYAKGAPEVILRLSEPNTVPGNVASVLESYTVRGYRVLAVAHRLLPQRLTWKAAQKAPREKLEQKLTFLGLLVLQNPLKAASSAAISELVRADIRPVMATGDNVLTGVSVARECGMVPPNAPVVLLSVTPPSGGAQPSPPVLSATIQRQDTPESAVVTVTPGDDQAEFLQRYHLAISGTSWKLLCLHFPQYVDAVCCRGTVFGRMSPDQKTQLVEALMELDYVVSMCGDGANDCGALKAAHVGISLSEAEASVAAPFTSNIADVSCVPRLIKEGRAALVTSFGVFKFMALYSIIQFVTVLMLYTFHTNLSDPQFLYIDLGIVTSTALFMGYSAASRSLVRERPSGSLLSPVTLFSVLLQVIAVIGGQVAAYYYLAAQPWFVPKKSDESDGGGAGDVSWEATVLFLASGVQYIALAIVYAPAVPYARPIYTNCWLMLSLVLFGVMSLGMLLYPGPWCGVLLMASELTELAPVFGDGNVPLDRVLWIFRGTLAMMTLVHLFLAWLINDSVERSLVLKRFFQRLSGKKQPKHRYKRVCSALREDASFPPLQRSVTPADQ